MRIVGKILQIEAESAVAGVGCQKGPQLALQVLPRRRILQHGGHAVIPLLREHVVVL